MKKITFLKHNIELVVTYFSKNIKHLGRFILKEKKPSILTIFFIYK